jgi:hypothetical protein
VRRRGAIMADLFVLLRDLGEQIANKGDGTGNRPLDNDAVESRFRSVLPNLLEGYLVPFKGISLVAW